MNKTLIDVKNFIFPFIFLTIAIEFAVKLSLPLNSLKDP